MKTINAEIVADSICNGHRITTMLLTYPRFVHSELMTHRVFSRNSASSRAIPVDKMIKAVRENTFCPFEFQKSHKGMQGSKYFTGAERQECVNLWLESAELALQQAEKMKTKGISKQIINRILEPYQYYTTLVTATEWNNFFELRCPKYHTPVSGEGFYFKSKKDCIANHSNPDNIKKLEGFAFYDWQSINTSQAEIHIQALAESMWDAMNESVPKELKEGEYHIPFGDNIDDMSLALITDSIKNVFQVQEGYARKYENTSKELDEVKIKIATARCARLSYMTFDNEIDYKKNIELHDRLLASGHMSPFEHCARAMDELEYEALVKTKSGYMTYEWDHGWCNNFRGWIQYRYLIENSN